MAPISSASVIPLVALLLGSSTAFLAPAGPAPAQFQRASVSRASRVRPASSATRAASATSSLRMVNEMAEEKAARLRETAAAFRAEAANLEEKREQDRRAGADRSFNTFDSNNDGAVDAAELKAGLETPLRRSFTKQLTARMGRKPSPEEVDERISQLPEGTLFPDSLARKLIAMYDQNGDGLLQKSEFAPTEELRARLENIFREQRDLERQARVEQRQREMEEKAVERGAVVSPGSSNDGPATGADRALAVIPYLLPLADSMTFAGHLLGAFPEQTAWAQPLAAALLALRSVPFATFAAFFGMSILSANPEVNKLVRFNMRQAINLDIALFVPGLIGSMAALTLGRDNYKLVPLANAGSDVIFVAMALAVVYSVVVSATGEIPNKLPLFGRANRENPDREEEEL